MKKYCNLLFIPFLLLALLSSCCSVENSQASAAHKVIENLIGEQMAKNVECVIAPTGNKRDHYDLIAKDGKVVITASSPSAICYAMNRYLREACGAMRTWSGENINLPATLPDYSLSQQSPYEHRYFLNVCTFGYTTPYWGWERWEQEIEFMALHGVNMPLATVAAEAIAKRVWLKMGLSDEEVDKFFTGAAHLPWHRMGNLNNFDGPLNDEWHHSQIEMQHKILKKMRELGMTPVAPAFAGFVPEAFMAKHPDLKFNFLEWGGFDKAENAYVLPPDSPLFSTIGELFIKEWEAEFGECKYYLSDSFNEMRLPIDKDDKAAKLKLLAEYGQAIYNSIAAGNPDAVWVTQGWTFGYQHDFWDKESLQALLSRVPDEKLIIIDLGNDYPKWVWHTEQTWKVHEGFYGKQWIYSYVPNFGGKSLPTGDLAMYASTSIDALESPYGQNLVGFGSAPEGLENNEIVYELLADMGWSDKRIDLKEWTKSYCTARYGGSSEQIEQAMELLQESAYSALRSYPRFTWQTVDFDKRRKSIHDLGNQEYLEAVKLFLSQSDKYSASELYRNDAIEYATTLIAAKADSHYIKALSAKEQGQNKVAQAYLSKSISLLSSVDSLLASHPRYRLSEWVEFARAAGSTPQESSTYESNAKRLITTWGGWQEDYAARFWSGLIRDYYIPRMEIYFSAAASGLDAWEERWLQSDWYDVDVTLDDPISTAKRIVDTL